MFMSNQGEKALVYQRPNFKIQGVHLNQQGKNSPEKAENPYHSQWQTGTNIQLETIE